MVAQQTVRALNGWHDRGIKFLRHLAKSFEADPRCPFSIDWTRYSPYCADFVLRNLQGAEIFVELKLNSCKIDNSQTAGLGLMNIQHHLKNTNDLPGHPSYFDYTGGRWTFLMTELLPASGQNSRQMDLPRTMLLLHRSDIPDHWWREDVDKTVSLTCCVPKSKCIVVDDQIAWNMSKQLTAAGPGSFRLPPLEPLGDLLLTAPVDEPSLNPIDNVMTKRVNDSRSDDEAEETVAITAATNEPTTHKKNNDLASDHWPDYIFQSSLSLLCARQCLHL